MKKFTDTQKKWALTATMIAALGCSVSFNSQPYKVTSMEFASEAASSAAPADKKLDFAKIEIKRGKSSVQAKLVADGDSTTVLLSPGKNTEGKASFECAGCLTEPITIHQPLSEKNLESISMAITAQLDDQNTEVAKPAEKARKESPAEARRKMLKKSSDYSSDEDGERVKKAKRMSRKDQMNALIEDGNKACSSRGELMYEGVELADCFATALVESLNNEDLKIDEAVAIRYYHESIAQDLAIGLSKYSSFSRNEDYEMAVNALQSLKNDLPRNQKSLYEQVVFTSAKAVERMSYEVRTLRSNQNTIEVANARFLDLTNLDLQNKRNLSFDSMNNRTLTPAEFQTVYQNAYIKPSQAVILPLSYGSNAQTGNIDPRLRNIPGVVPAPVNGRTTSNGRAVLNEQIQNQQTFPALQAPNSFGLQELSIPGTLNQNQTLPEYQSGLPVVPTADQVIQANGLPAVVLLEQGTSDGLLFGQPRTVTPQALQEAQRIRAQQGQRIWVQQ